MSEGSGNVVPFIVAEEHNDVARSKNVVARGFTGTTYPAINVDADGDIQADIKSIATGTNNIGDVDVLSIAAGDNNIGNVDIASAIPAGTNNIGDVDILSLIPGTGATNLGKIEDAAHTSGDVGVLALSVAKILPTLLVDADGDYAPLQTDSAGRLRVANDGGIIGNVAHDATDSGNPVKVGGQ